jgi:hypothetical protein
MLVNFTIFQVTDVEYTHKDIWLYLCIDVYIYIYTYMYIGYSYVHISL